MTRQSQNHIAAGPGWSSRHGWSKWKWFRKETWTPMIACVLLPDDADLSRPKSWLPASATGAVSLRAAACKPAASDWELRLSDPLIESKIEKAQKGLRDIAQNLSNFSCQWNQRFNSFAHRQTDLACWHSSSRLSANLQVEYWWARREKLCFNESKPVARIWPRNSLLLFQTSVAHNCNHGWHHS